MKKNSFIILICILFTLSFSINVAYSASEWINMGARWDANGCVLNVQDKTTNKWSAGAYHRNWEDNVVWENSVSKGDKLYVDAYTCYNGGKLWIYEDDELVFTKEANGASNIEHEFEANANKIRIACNTNGKDEERLSVTIILKGDTHKHSYSPKYDEMNHWEECSCGKIKNEAEHTFGKWQNGESGYHIRKCSKCEYVDKHGAEIKTNYYPEDDNKHTVVEECDNPDCEIELNTKTESHTFGDYKVDSNSDLHYRSCSKCGQRVSHDKDMEARSDDKYTWKQCKVCEIIEDKVEIPSTPEEGDPSNGEEVPRAITSIEYEEGSLQLYPNHEATFRVLIGESGQYSKKQIQQLIDNNSLYLTKVNTSIIDTIAFKALDGKVQVYVKANADGKAVIKIESTGGAALQFNLNIAGVVTGGTNEESEDPDDDLNITIDTDEDTQDEESDTNKTKLTKFKFSKTKLKVNYNEEVNLKKYLQIEPKNVNTKLYWECSTSDSIKLRKDGKITIDKPMTEKYAVITVTDKISKKSTSIKIVPKGTYIPPEGETQVPEDISEDAWYLMAVMQALKDGIFSGMDDTHFNPNGKITRGMFVTALSRLDKSETEGYVLEFTDVEKDAYYAEAIAWATGNKLVSGMGEKKFKPDESITREQMATIIYKYINKFHNYLIPSGKKINLEMYKDNGKISSWAQKGVYYLNYLQIMQGKGSKKFDPQGLVTRAEACQVLVNLQDRITEDFHGTEFRLDKKHAAPAEDKISDYEDALYQNVAKAIPQLLDSNGNPIAKEKAYEMYKNGKLPKTRAAVVAAALSLCSMDFYVHYLGLGRIGSPKEKCVACYPYIGINPTWGKAVPGRDGGRRTNGMDCTNFVDWSFVNGYVDKEGTYCSMRGINRGTWDNEKKYYSNWLGGEKAKAEAKPGDIYGPWGYRNGRNEITHIGLIVGVDKDYYFIAESVNEGVMIRAYKKNGGVGSYYWRSMDDHYDQEGNMPEVNWAAYDGRLGRTSWKEAVYVDR